MKMLSARKSGGDAAMVATRRVMSEDEFYQTIAKRDILAVCNNALLEIERYYGMNAHHMPAHRKAGQSQQKHLRK